MRRFLNLIKPRHNLWGSKDSRPCPSSLRDLFIIWIEEVKIGLASSNSLLLLSILLSFGSLLLLHPVALGVSLVHELVIGRSVLLGLRTAVFSTAFATCVLDAQLLAIAGTGLLLVVRELRALDLLAVVLNGTRVLLLELELLGRVVGLGV
eukprot:CAMPEP_0114583336 /NCGR_PEP_ID=MMETSP0125-20121206/7090_1 /TAXON_ID=485358 ORGANISM="Aristerostoma sp., Strain ATCC 50986" /NCGR_SAMPLE_ID=MMETSP0125 /ASSEMBLY_ACC=CAM_ASM_000245 /LENGTH=150 /DNA_ID=CAMNT_0001776733 /DNA_START=654 /DNA_END=1106 /DNA_ORIENTATION=-